MKTITLCIGNSDDKLTQKEWATFIKEIENLLGCGTNDNVQFSGFSSPDAPWQNACYVFGLEEIEIDYFKDRMRIILRSYDQDSAAIAIGDVEFVKSEDPTKAEAKRKEYVAHLRVAAKRLSEEGMACNCDLDKWQPEPTTGHSHVCRIHKAAVTKCSSLR